MCKRQKSSLKGEKVTVSTTGGMLRRRKMEKKEIRIGLYGSNGHQIGRDVTEKLKGKAVVAAVAGMTDGTGTGTEGGDSEPKIIQYKSLADMLADDSLDLISLCSPVRKEQEEHAVECLRAGKHVYAEKPCAMSEEALDRIFREADKAGKEFHEMAATNFLYPYYELGKLVRKGIPGRIVQVYTQKSYPLLGTSRPQDERIDGGLALQAGIHNLRMTEGITGLKVMEMVAYQTQAGNPGEGQLHTAVSFAMKLEKGAVASACTNYLNPREGTGRHGYEGIRIFGTRGMAETTDGGRGARIVWEDGTIQQVEPDPERKSFLEYYIDHLLGNGQMPMDREEEFHPLRALLRMKCMENMFKDGE